MRTLYDPARLEPLAGGPWSAPRARDAIAAICRDAETAFDPHSLWPVHLNDVEPGEPPDGIFRGLYLVAAGMLHALDRLDERDVYVSALDTAAVVEAL